MPQSRPTTPPPVAKTAAAPPPIPPTAVATCKLRWKETRELEALAAVRNKVGGDYQRLGKATAELEAAQSALDVAMELWLVLSEV